MSFMDFLKRTNEIQDVEYLGVIDVNKEIAKEILKNNYSNRKIKNATLDAYINDLQNNNWHILPDSNTLTFDEELNLLNGQHRLSAIIKAEKEMSFFIFIKKQKTNAMNELFDIGILRRCNELLNYSIPKTALISSILRFIKPGRKMTPNIVKNFFESLTQNQKEIIDIISSVQNKYVKTDAKCKAVLFFYICINNPDFINKISELFSFDTNDLQLLKIREFLLKNKEKSTNEREVCYKNRALKFYGFLLGLKPNVYGKEDWQLLQVQNFKNWYEIQQNLSIMEVK